MDFRQISIFEILNIGLFFIFTCTISVILIYFCWIGICLGFKASGKVFSKVYTKGDDILTKTNLTNDDKLDELFVVICKIDESVCPQLTNDDKRFTTEIDTIEEHASNEEDICKDSAKLEELFPVIGTAQENVLSVENNSMDLFYEASDFNVECHI